MLPMFLSLVCLGFFLYQTTWAEVEVSTKVILSAWPSPMVPIGENVTLHCHSQLGFEMFRLFKEDVVNIREFQDVLSQQHFDMYPVTMAHGGTYRCQGFDPKAPYALSEISDPLLIIVTGAYKKPSLLALPAPSVKSGEMVTLQCCSETMFETFILVVDKEEVNDINLYLVGQPYAGGSQANVSIAPVTAAHAGTYRCYTARSRHSPVWSEPSDPLELVVTGPVAANSSYPFNLTQGSVIQNYTLGNSIRMGVSGLVLLILLIILRDAWWNHEKASQVEMRETSARTQRTYGLVE